MRYTLHISEELLFQLENHAEKQLPSEAVALLFGFSSGTDALVNRIELVKNDSTRNRTSFSVNPEIQYALLMDADNHGESMVGIFHSHPAPPFPSMSDHKNMKLNPVIWLIASKTTREWMTKAYILEEEVPIEVKIEFTPQSIDSVP